MSEHSEKKGTGSPEEQVKTAPRPRARSKKSKKTRRIVAAAVAVAVVAGAAGGGVVAYRSTHKSTVNVYSMGDIAMTDYWGAQSESDGMITSKDLQTVYLSGTQELAEIYVTEGQEVKKGDPLFSYDSTLTQLDIDRAELTVQQKKLDLEAANKELATIKTYRAGVAIPGSRQYHVIQPDPTPSKPKVTYTLKPTSGSGTKADPYVFAWEAVEKYNGGAFDEKTLQQLSQGKNDAYVILRMPAGISAIPDTPEESPNPSEAPEDSQTPEPSEPTEETTPAAPAAPVVDYSTLKLQIQCVDDSYTYTVLSMSVNGSEVVLSDPLDPPPEEEEEPENTGPSGYYDEGIVYTATEIAKMRSDKEQQIRQLELDIRQAQLDCDKKKQEADNNTVYSELDGTVVLLGDPKIVGQTDPLVKISADGGYAIKAVLGEFDLEGVSVGQTVEVNVYGESMTSCQGVITWISEYPASGNDSYFYYGGGNNNISKYPFIVEVSGEENLNEGDYAEIYYSPEGQEKSGIYLENTYIRTENGKSYVYVEREGKLTKQYVATGMSVWGSYTEIKSGLTMDDYVAFPYGTEVKEGAKTVESDISELYSTLDGYYY